MQPEKNRESDWLMGRRWEEGGANEADKEQVCRGE